MCATTVILMNCTLLHVAQRRIDFFLRVATKSDFGAIQCVKILFPGENVKFVGAIVGAYVGANVGLFTFFVVNL